MLGDSSNVGTQGQQQRPKYLVLVLVGKGAGIVLYCAISPLMFSLFSLEANDNKKIGATYFFASFITNGVLSYAFASKFINRAGILKQEFRSYPRLRKGLICISLIPAIICGLAGFGLAIESLNESQITSGLSSGVKYIFAGFNALNLLVQRLVTVEHLIYLWYETEPQSSDRQKNKLIQCFTTFLAIIGGLHVLGIFTAKTHNGLNNLRMTTHTFLDPMIESAGGMCSSIFYGVSILLLQKQTERLIVFVNSRVKECWQAKTGEEIMQAFARLAFMLIVLVFEGLSGSGMEKAVTDTVRGPEIKYLYLFRSVMSDKFIAEYLPPAVWAVVDLVNAGGSLGFWLDNKWLNPPEPGRNDGSQGAAPLIPEDTVEFAPCKDCFNCLTWFRSADTPNPAGTPNPGGVLPLGGGVSTWRNLGELLT